MSATFLGFLEGTMMVVSQMLGGSISPGDAVTGVGVSATTVISQIAGATGFEGAYLMSAAQTVGPETLSTGGGSTPAFTLLGQIVC